MRLLSRLSLDRLVTGPQLYFVIRLRVGDRSRPIFVYRDTEILVQIPHGGITVAPKS